MKRLILIFFFITQANARVLSLSDENFASYFSGEYSTSVMKTSPFDSLLTSTETFSEQYKNGYGGEFGFVYSTPYIGWRFSFEFLKPAKLSGVQSTNNSGTTNYLVSSDITSVAPKIGIELHLNKRPNSRFYLFGFYGSANLTMVNTYTQMLISPNSDYEANLKASSSVYGGGLGFEWSFVDTTTLGLELGYRSLKFSEITYSKNVTTIQGSSVAGDLYKDGQGSNKTLNMSSTFLSLAFRFWL